MTIVEDLPHSKSSMRGITIRQEQRTHKHDACRCASRHTIYKTRQHTSYLFVFRDHSPREVSTSTDCFSNACLCLASFKKRSLFFAKKDDGCIHDKVSLMLKNIQNLC
jgi:hypothetical protein